MCGHQRRRRLGGIETFAEERESWLRGFLELPNGIPSHDTLSDVMGRIKPKAFSEAFTAWVHAALPTLSEEQVAIDGKALRGRRQAGSAQPDGHAVHLMSAFAAQARLVLWQQPVADKGNEITAIASLLDMLDVSGAVVTIDAIGCQKAIAQKIVERKADIIFAHAMAWSASRRSCADIGQLRTASIGRWMCNLAKTPTAAVKTTRRPIRRSCDAWR